MAIHNGAPCMLTQHARMPQLLGLLRAKRLVIRNIFSCIGLCTLNCGPWPRVLASCHPDPSVKPLKTGEVSFPRSRGTKLFHPLIRRLSPLPYPTMDPSQFTPEQLAYQQATFNESTAWEIYTTSIVGIVVAVGTTIMRFFARRYRKADLKSDDWLMVLAVVRVALPVRN